MFDDEKAFKNQYTATFLGAYAALHYDQNCAHGWTNLSQPVEDADDLANEAWTQWLKAR